MLLTATVGFSLVQSQEPGVLFRLSLLESSLDSPEFPFLGGVFGATAWL